MPDARNATSQLEPSGERPGREWSMVVPVLVTFLLVLAVAFALFCFAYPRADDLMRAGLRASSGPLAAVVEEYRGWSGRWAGTGLGYLLAGTPQLESAYPWLLLGLAASIVASVYLLISSAFSDHLSCAARWLLAVGFLVLYWTGSPSVPEAFYWLTGSIENQLSVSLGMTLLAGLVRSARRDDRNHPVWMAALASLAVFTSGVHELFGMVLGLILCAGTLLAFRLRLPARWTWTATLAACVFGVAFVVLAPGNAVRQHLVDQLAALHAGARTWAALGIGVGYIGQCWLGWILDPKLLLATLLVLVTPPYASTNPPWLERGVTQRWWLVFPVLMVLLAGLMLAAAWYAQGGYLPGRTLSGCYLFFLVGWLATAFFVSRLGRKESRVTIPYWPRLAVMTLWCLSLLALGNFRTAATDLHRNVRPYDQAMRQRYALIRGAIARGELDVRLSPLPVIPRSLGFQADLVRADDEANPRSHVNMQNAIYFHLRSIALQSAAPGN
jgi:hypothetical protein